MKHQINHRYSGAVLYEAEIHDTPSGMETQVALEKAVAARANLDSAYLARAYLDGANLAAYLAGAYLDGAKLDDGAKIVGSRPIFQIGPIGSRCAYLVAYITDKGLRLRTGCFFGTREEFERRLSKERGDNDHAKEYRAALALIDAHAEIWTPKVEVSA